MNSSEPASPKLPMWAFFATDVVLLGTAWFIAENSARPLSGTATLAIVGCVLAGAIVALVPLVVRYERAKNETLDERQRALESLARTVASSAEQISIAAGGLHEIAEIAQKNLKHAEQLPHKLQDKIAEFSAQLANANDAEKEELEKELVALRTTESDRLEAISDKISKSTGEWSKLEAATEKHLADATDALGKLALGTASAIGKAQAAAEQALSQARVEAARSIGEAAGAGARSLEEARKAAVADFEAKLAAASAALAEKTAADIAAKLAPHFAALSVAATATPAAPESPAPTAATAPAAPSAETAEPKRPRKPRREEPAEPSTVPPSSPESAPAAPAEPTPIVLERIPEVTPIAPHTQHPFNGEAPESSSGGAATAIAIEPPVVAVEIKTARKRVKKTEPDPDAAPALDLGSEETVVRNGNGEGGLSSDGATRLIVTSYIGIGNRLFIRGEGPGLSWDKGVPLQFVSIGKWRWETNDATGPVRFKLLKNDEAECAALGAQHLDPGHQQEVTAAF